MSLIEALGIALMVGGAGVASAAWGESDNPSCFFVGVSVSGCLFYFGLDLVGALG